MYNRFPGIRALRALEAAGRHLNFTKAADELGLTPAAVSHQVKEFQEQLGVVLFERVGREMRHTPAGEAIHIANTRVRVLRSPFGIRLPPYKGGWAVRENSRSPTRVEFFHTRSSNSQFIEALTRCRVRPTSRQSRLSSFEARRPTTTQRHELRNSGCVKQTRPENPDACVCDQDFASSEIFECELIPVCINPHHTKIIAS